MIPFMTEEIYQNLVRSIDKTAPESIHLCDFPAVDEAHDRQASWKSDMDEVLKIVVYGPCGKKYRKHQEPSADRPECLSRQKTSCPTSM